MLKPPKSPLILAMIPWILVTMVCGPLPGFVKLRCGKENSPSAPEAGWMQVDEGFTAPGSSLPREMEFEGLACTGMLASEVSWRWLPVHVNEQQIQPFRGRGVPQGRAPPGV
jgi:hypothetical protein